MSFVPHRDSHGEESRFGGPEGVQGRRKGRNVSRRPGSVDVDDGGNDGRRPVRVSREVGCVRGMGVEPCPQNAPKTGSV